MITKGAAKENQRMKNIYHQIIKLIITRSRLLKVFKIWFTIIFLNNILLNLIIQGMSNFIMTINFFILHSRRF